jgi:methionine synthase I (cobalamin-dependent)
MIPDEIKNITFKVNGKEYTIPTPFTFKFYIWLFELIIPNTLGDLAVFYNNMTSAIYKNFNMIQSKLTGLTEVEIEDSQTTDELKEAFNIFENQFVEEAKTNPFIKALWLTTRIKVKLSREQAEELMKKIKEIEPTGTGL